MHYGYYYYSIWYNYTTLFYVQTDIYGNMAYMRVHVMCMGVSGGEVSVKSVFVRPRWLSVFYICISGDCGQAD